MTSQIDVGRNTLSLDQILFDPLSYVNKQRLPSLHGLDQVRQRAVVNRLLLRDLPVHKFVTYSCPLLRYWAYLPYVCILVGAQRLKSQLTWGGELLHLPSSVRSFMELPIYNAKVVGGGIFPRGAENLSLLVQQEGLTNLLDWQKKAPPALLGRLRLMFPPQMDTCFTSNRESLTCTDLFLISQAILYAKNHPYSV